MNNMPNRRKRTGGNPTFTLVLIIALLLVCFIYCMSSVIKNYTPADAVDLRVAPKQDDQQNVQEQKSPSGLPEGYTVKNIGYDEIYSGDLILVNNDIEYKFDKTSAENPRQDVVTVYSSKNNSYYVKDMSIKLCPKTIENANKMFSDYVKFSGKADLLINAAYRSYDDQVEIQNEKIKQLGEEQGRLIAANPGYSEHHSGLAFDICIYDDGAYAAFDGLGKRSWMHENCYKYGFILRYPEGKTDITKITYEPWHYRYVGIPHAQYITENNLCFEEYIELLKTKTFEKEHLYVDCDDGNKYEIYYIGAEKAGEDIKVTLPENAEYTLSGNNTDGIVVCVKLNAAQ